MKTANQPNILLLLCDQLRFDAIAALGNSIVKTPNIDRLVRRGIAFTNAYSTCPVCVPARYTLRTGCEPWNTGCYQNEKPTPMDNLPQEIGQRCGGYLAAELGKLGYRTFGIGKFHTLPEAYENLGYDYVVHTEEIWRSAEDKARDGYIRFLRKKHPDYSHIEQVHGERTEMYYMPQTSPFPAGATVERFVADEIISQMSVGDSRPWFAFASFIGPHPPFAPPIPYNRMYNPDEMPPPAESPLKIDHMDEQIPFMNHLIWADEIDPFRAKALKARYYGEITYIDDCIGRILDEVEALPDGDNTMILLSSDHGDHLGDHHAWQKESYFEAACRIPLLVSWPKRLPTGGTCAALACLTDIFGTVTAAAGHPQERDGMNLLSLLEGEQQAREFLFSCYGRPGTPRFKCMLREGKWKYIYCANGARQQLFDLESDPGETINLTEIYRDETARLRDIATHHCTRPGLLSALDGASLREFAFEARPPRRIHQFDITVEGNAFGSF